MRYVQRHTRWQRFIHGTTALLMVLLMLSGLALFHPSLFFLSDLFGGGTGAASCIRGSGWRSASAFCFSLRASFTSTCGERRHEVARPIGRRAGKRDERLPELGQYNAGEKLVFWG